MLDVDIRGFFDAIDHGWLTTFIEHRIADRRVVRHVKKWLNAGVLEDGKRMRVGVGTPQGGSISPLLANIYLHYVFDLWVRRWRREQARGDVIIVRFADDIVVGFQYRSEAERFWEELRERFRMYNLELHPHKTRLIEFGRFAVQSRKGRGQGKPETFDFLGFTHICSRKKNGKFVVLRRPMRVRMRAKLRAVKAELRRRLHDPVPEVARWLGTVVRGYYQYYAVPRTTHVLLRYRYYVLRMWYRSLKRRSHKTLMTWAWMCRIAQRWVAWPRIVYPYPEQRLCVSTLGRSPVR